MPSLRWIILYARDVEETVVFYGEHFGFKAVRLPEDRIVELVSPDGGAGILVHAAGKAVKFGQATVKLSFQVADVEVFCAERSAKGMVFGPLHKADGYVFANAKDPNGNPISVSGRPVAGSADVLVRF
jgi:predicted enzyme related to lactoylglutathione lyase